MDSIQILDCYMKPRRGAAMERRRSLDCLAGFGIADDANAHPASPRQVLLVDDTVYRHLDLPTCALRENLLIHDLHDAGLRSGDTLRGPSGAVLRVTFECEPCVKLNVVRPGLAQEVAGHRGVLARVVMSGQLLPGEALEIVRGRLDPLPSTFGERVHHILRSVPHGRVTTFSHITTMAGVPRTFARVLPRILRSAPADVPTHRTVTSSGGLVTAHVGLQRQLLETEGVAVDRDQVHLGAIWSGDPYRVEENAFTRA